MMLPLSVRLLALSLLASSLAQAAPPPKPSGHTGTSQSTRLYTKPDPSAGGGIRVTIQRPTQPVLSAFAIAMFDPKFVYKAQVSGNTLEWTGLPSAKYDLLVLYADRFYEGLHLSSEPDTLTDLDRQKISASINRSVPFFNFKKIHRVEGTTGAAGKAACMLQEMRTNPVMLQSAVERSDIQIRSLKIVQLEDVGTAGWNLEFTREIVRTEVSIPLGEWKGELPHHYAPALGGIRVIDRVKELAPLTLDAKRETP